jgi:hypothetical protein
MNERSSSAFNPNVLSAWQDELKAIGNRNLRQQCQQQECELLPCFAEHYRQPRALRQRVRRSLQRQGKRSLTWLVLPLALRQALVFNYYLYPVFNYYLYPVFNYYLY